MSANIDVSMPPSKKAKRHSHFDKQWSIDYERIACSIKGEFIYCKGTPRFINKL